MKLRKVIMALVMPGPSPQYAVIRPSGIKYNSATRVVSSASRRVNKNVVTRAINPNANRYLDVLEINVELRMKFIIPF